MKVIISLAQLQIIKSDVRANFEKAQNAIEKASARGSHLILLPELWSSAYDLPNRADYAQQNERIRPAIQKLANEFKIIIGGSWIESINGEYFNVFNLFIPFAAETEKYSKIHLFRLMNEEQWFSPGNSLKTVNLPWGKTGLATCYDLRFPEIFRRYALEGVSLILLVAEWPKKRAYHWNTLLRARAIENQCFIAGVNCVGKIGDDTFGGGSAIISPWGDPVTEADEEKECLLSAEIDLEEVEKIREWMPILKDRRPELYP